MPLRRCLREPIPDIEMAARRLDEAISAHERGEREVAAALLRQANEPALRDWLESAWGKLTAYNRPRRVLPYPPALPAGERLKPRDASRETKRHIHYRDGYYCRFCSMPVIRSQVRNAIRSHYPDAVPWGNKNTSQHAAFQCMWAQYDHILPHARGGSSTLENVYLTCAACNYGRGNFLLEELDLIHPDRISPRVGDWDGLERFGAAKNG